MASYARRTRTVTRRHARLRSSLASPLPGIYRDAHCRAAPYGVCGDASYCHELLRHLADMLRRTLARYLRDASRRRGIKRNEQQIGRRRQTTVIGVARRVARRVALVSNERAANSKRGRKGSGVSA